MAEYEIVERLSSAADSLTSISESLTAINCTLTAISNALRSEQALTTSTGGPLSNNRLSDEGTEEGTTTHPNPTNADSLTDSEDRAAQNASSVEVSSERMTRIEAEIERMKQEYLPGCCWLDADGNPL